MDRRTSWLRSIATLGLAAVALMAGVANASATTLVMPDRPALKATNVVLWGNTTLANGTAFTLDCGDGGAAVAGNVVDQTYISRICNYASAGTFTATLTVGAESATSKISVGDPATLSAFDLRALKIDNAIEDGLRFLYYSQFDRVGRFATNMTSWRSNSNENRTNSFSALAILALQNHGHSVTADPNKDIFQPVVQRGLNWVFDTLQQRDLTPCAETAGNPCVNVPAPVNIGLSAITDGLDGYATPILAGAIAAARAAAPARTVDAGLGSNNANFVAGKTYSEILQRVVNAVVWGQSDSAPGEGGWFYSLQAGSSSDGSTLGWALLGLIDAGAAGATVPAFAKTEVAKVLVGQLNNNGSLDYQVDSDPTTDFSNPAKTGIGLQGLGFTGALVSDPRVTAGLGYLTRNWNTQTAGDFLDFVCAGGTPTTTNKGCGYAMFNIFKGLKLLGVSTLPGIGRAAGPGPIPADDWYADYVDNLLANQHLPSDPTRGEWSAFDAPSMGWSCCESDTTGITALAELILSPVAFVLPDPDKFATVGLSPATATNAIGTNHTVTATALSSNDTPVAGATVEFKVLTGPNTGQTGTDVTDSNGQATFTYTDTGGAGTDTIQAFIGVLGSNVVEKIWSSGAPVPASITLAPLSASNPVGGSHTVTATVLDASNAPMAGQTVTYTVTAGPNAGATGQSATDANGQSSFTYNDVGGAGTDTIQATVSNLTSNSVTKTWGAFKCPLGQGYWKSHPHIWPVDQLTLGSQTYTKAELLRILKTAANGDASLILAYQLIAAKLNIANGSDPGPAAAAIADADSLLSGFTGKLPYKVRPHAPTRAQMIADANSLTRYNAGHLTPGCVR